MNRDERLFALFAPVTRLAGIGPGLGRALGRLLGRQDPRIIDLLLHAPIGERDLALLEHAQAFNEGEKAALRVSIERHIPAPRGSRRPHKVVAAAGGVAIDLAFFNARERYLNERFPVGADVHVFGRLSLFGERWQMQHPEILPASEAELRRAAMIYAATEGLSQNRLRNLAQSAVASVPALPEWLPDELKAQMSWPGFAGALAAMHGQSADFNAEQGRRRLAFDELFALQLALRLSRHRQHKAAKPPPALSGKLLERLKTKLPFAPTGAQLRAMGEIRGDLARDEPMARLLMGDVGSGKTLVAFAAMLEVAAAGGQAALMAPTELLAEQHAATIREWGGLVGVEAAVLSSGTNAKDRRATGDALAEGTLKIVVGTHALIQPAVTFADLRLVIIDEQHRFGVNQRLALLNKGQGTDLLLTTATPIPRSLVLAQYGDVQVSVLDEKPAGRLPIQTIAMPSSRLDELRRALRRALDQGQRVYWVCPSIDPGEDERSPSVNDRFDWLRQEFGETVEFVHGRMRASDKQRAVQRFAVGEARILVATTVIEVGVDVPSATLIVIDAAESFGLAQLHQLRGRVGRGERQSTAILLYSPPLSSVARERLRTIRATDDGFTIAEADLGLRGPGEILGQRQSGMARFKIVDLAKDTDLVTLARDQAVHITSSHPNTEDNLGCDLKLLLQIFEHDINADWLSGG